MAPTVVRPVAALVADPRPACEPAPDRALQLYRLLSQIAARVDAAESIEEAGKGSPAGAGKGTA